MRHIVFSITAAGIVCHREYIYNTSIEAARMRVQQDLYADVLDGPYKPDVRMPIDIKLDAYLNKHSSSMLILAISWETKYFDVGYVAISSRVALTSVSGVYYYRTLRGLTSILTNSVGMHVTGKEIDDDVRVFGYGRLDRNSSYFNDGVIIKL